MYLPAANTTSMYVPAPKVGNVLASHEVPIELVAAVLVPPTATYTPVPDVTPYVIDVNPDAGNVPPATQLVPSPAGD